jgi:hypothetical protein
MTTLLVIGLVLCNLLYFLPRQLELHKDYSGLPAGINVHLATAYNPSVHKAIIVTNDYSLYQLELFQLNDPLLKDDVIYAQASGTADYLELHKAFPDRKLYLLDILPDGSIHLVQLVI